LAERPITFDRLVSTRGGLPLQSGGKPSQTRHYQTQLREFEGGRRGDVASTRLMREIGEFLKMCQPRSDSCELDTKERYWEAGGEKRPGPAQGKKLHCTTKKNEREKTPHS